MKDLVSIITPSFNSSKFIRQTIETVLSQTYQNWELLIVDDCSTDDTVDIAQMYADNDARIRIKQLEVNSGAAIARNNAIKMSRGRFVAFLDSDDLWLPKKLDKQIKYMSNHNYCFTHTYYDKIDEEGTKLNTIVKPPKILDYREMLKSNQIGCLTAIYDSNTLGKLYMPIIRNRQDYGLWLKILKMGHKAICLPEVLSTYRIRNHSISRNKFKMLGYHYKLYRYIEDQSLSKTIYYLGWNIIRKIKSH